MKNINYQANYSKEYIRALKILTPKEIEILEKVSLGNTNSEIAKDLYLSKRTIEKHRENMCKKLRIKGYRSLFHWCQVNMHNF